MYWYEVKLDPRRIIFYNIDFMWVMDFRLCFNGSTKFDFKLKQIMQFQNRKNKYLEVLKWVINEYLKPS